MATANVRITDNIVVSGYLREHEKLNKIEIPRDVASNIVVFCKEYSVHTIGLKNESHTLHTLQTMIKNCLMHQLYVENNRDRLNKTINTIYTECMINSSNTYHSFYRFSWKAFDNGFIKKTENEYFERIHNKYFLKHLNDKIVEIKCGKKHSLFLTLFGFVYSFGINDAGQCGVDEEINCIKTPILINNNKYTDIACGELHSLFIDINGKLLVCGYNYCGQLGIKWLSKTSVFQHDSDEDDDEDKDEDEHRFCTFKPIINQYFDDLHIKFNNISCGSFHSLCITKNGECYTFGHNGFGNLGNGKCTEWGQGTYIPNKLKTDKRFIDSSCGKNHNVLITDKNQIVVFGDNENNQCSFIYQNKNENNKQIIKTPRILSKEKEFGISEHCFIEKVICMDDESLIFIDFYKRIWVQNILCI